MRKRKGILPILAGAILTLTMMAAPAFAATTVPGTDEVTFDKYLTMDEHANVPDADFAFEIAPGTAVAAVTTGNKTPAVISGPVGAKLSYDGSTAASVTVGFAPGDTTYDAAQGTDTVALAANAKYAKKTVTVDLKGVTFTEPGIFRYDITETATNDGVTNDTVSTRYLDVYINSSDTGDLSVAGYVLHNTTAVKGALGGAYDTDPDVKDEGFQNDYVTYDLIFSKQITGNQGFRSKYFTFTVNIANANPNTVYDVELGNATTGDISGKSNPTSLTVGADGTVEGTFYLKDDETIVLYGLTSDTQYTVSEDEEDYTPSYTLDNAAKVDGNSTPANAAMNGTGHAVEFTNYRNGVVPTGVMLDIAPYAIVVLLAGGAVALIVGMRRRNASQ